ncbi:YkvA family protein [Falsiroseomonas sp. CW058]|uniref:YkvA family protein n=1 Tax=Falsiroseomonas sp. CW058 TaxID=3388664 RepID=UPI003D31A514
MLARLKGWARAVKRDAILLWLAARHPAVPWAAKLLAAGIAAYAFSPIDLIPDVIPVIGFLDEVILLPGLVWLTLRLIPPPLRAELRAQAEGLAARPVSRAGAVAVVLAWVAAAALIGWILLGRAV